MNPCANYQDKCINDLNMQVTDESLSTGESDNKDSDIEYKTLNNSF
jgi:hypothetical protein